MNLHSFKPEKQACMILGAQKHTAIRNHNMLLVCWLCLNKFNVVWNEALVELNVAGTGPAAYSLEKSMSASSTYSSHTRDTIPKDTKTFWESIEKFLKGLLENMITTFPKSTFNYQYLGRHDFNPRLPSGGWITFSSGGCASPVNMYFIKNRFMIRVANTSYRKYMVVFILNILVGLVGKMAVSW